MLVVTHKNTIIPDEDIYQPVLVGEAKDSLDFESYFRDDKFDNIAAKNPNYSELTALYWAWKNLEADYIGLVHYRRYFMSKKNRKEIVSATELEELLEKTEVILPKKRKYYIENTWDHYKHNHNIEDLIKTREILERKYPQYLPSFDESMKRTQSHRFNMMIMSKERFDEYSKWLFDILFSLEKEVNISNYDNYQSRVYGFISERLLDVWIETNKIRYEELPYRFTENQNWFKKGGKFIYNKFRRSL